MIKMNRHIFNAVFVSALSFFVMSCGKENITNGENNSTSENGMIKIKLSQSSTKTTLGDDGRTPKFSAGDTIGVYNSKTQTASASIVKIDENSNEAYIEVPEEQYESISSLVYPEKFGFIEIDDVTESKNYSTTIPAEQTGKFCDANICKANDINFESGYAYFTNAVAMLYFDLTNFENINKIEIKSNEDINNDPNKSNRLTTVNGELGGKKCYVASKATTEGKTARIVLGNKSCIINMLRLNTNTIYEVDLSNYDNWTDYPSN